MKRKTNRMPAFVKNALNDRELMALYKKRPPYQRNDYVGWITGAKRNETQQRRLSQMVRELRKGDVYMGMKWNGQRT